MSKTRKQFLQQSLLALLSGAGMFRGTQLLADKGYSSSQKIKPKALQAGDTLGLVAPASPIYQSSVFQEMLINLEELGFSLKLGESVQKQRGYLAGPDEARARDLMDMFEDDEVDGIMCIRGGWGSNRILPLLDFEIIKMHPKVFCGFSDITSLHMALYEKSDLITFHGPVGKSVWTPTTTKAFQQVIFKGESPEFCLPKEEKDAFTITPGVASGKLFGGNLSVLTSMMGSDYLPTFKGAILFLEDIGESVYRIDRMMTQLKLNGILYEISGFVFGKCTDCSAGTNSLSMQEMLNDHLKPLKIPAFYGALISHEDDNITLPVGIRAEIDAGKKSIRLLEPAVV
ncbi:S66 peptidase family protein [Gracilimonas mengyeensis]|uniref:Muramoyltetrapeptide carboxypeptidase n=1 Tax=Gracilimonas mengyeensis TaxID=1302730 RepID=A0A521AP63_9BACT|nr:LD-carboxypeptidase [Gracilimonas mengyeensis]SMO36619.1 muramoyltetrapeptide carboxypeptidase [Gracilimonas mengyeensis]